MQGTEPYAAEYMIMHLKPYLLTQLGITTDYLPQKR